MATVDEFGSEFGRENVLYKRCDVTSHNSFEQVFDFAVDSFGSVDVVVNNAGTNGENNWETMIDINLKVSYKEIIR